MKAIVKALCLAAFGLFLVQPSLAVTKVVGAVDKVEKRVQAKQGDDLRRLAVSAPVLFRDVLISGPDARLQATLEDGTQLTLGENASLTIDEYVYEPGAQGNRLALDVKGAFLFVGGRIEGPTGGNVAINTPVGTLGVRGTTVWGGPVDNGFGVIVLDGQVEVTTKGGHTVVLGKGEGTMIFDANGEPTDAVAWPEARLKRAVQTITFGID